MNDIMMNLFEYAAQFHLPDYRSSPEYIASYRRFVAQDAALRALLDEDGRHILNELLNEQTHQLCMETFAFFEAAFAVNRELKSIV